MSVDVNGRKILELLYQKWSREGRVIVIRVARVDTGRWRILV
jgi:hypothetical protein